MSGPPRCLAKPCGASQCNGATNANEEWTDRWTERAEWRDRRERTERANTDSDSDSDEGLCTQVGWGICHLVFRGLTTATPTSVTQGIQTEKCKQQLSLAAGSETSKISPIPKNTRKPDSNIRQNPTLWESGFLWPGTPARY